MIHGDRGFNSEFETCVLATIKGMGEKQRFTALPLLILQIEERRGWQMGKSYPLKTNSLLRAYKHTLERPNSNKM